MDILIILSSFLLSVFFLSYSQSFFIKKKIFDPINTRSSHTGIATRNGGISIFLTLLLISVYFYLQGSEIFDYSYLIPISILLVVGLYDDIYDVDFKLKFLFQIITAKILIDNGVIIDNFHGILGLYELNRIFAQIFSVFIIVAIINSINFIDGIDGLAVSVVSIFIILFEYFSLNETEFKTISSGIVKLTFTLAVSRKIKSNTGGLDTDFIPISIIGPPAIVGSKLLFKGSPTLLWGHINVRRYEKDNETKWITEVYAENFQLLEKKKKSGYINNDDIIIDELAT